MPDPRQHTIRSADEIELESIDNQIVPLASSMLASMHYDKDDRTLDLAFRSGRTYTLSDVPPDIVLGLVHASSPGRYFNDNIKGKYV